MYDFLSAYLPYMVVLSVGAASNVAQLTDTHWTGQYFTQPIEFVTLIAFLAVFGFLFRWVRSSITLLHTRITRIDEGMMALHEAHIDPLSPPLKPRLLPNAVLLHEVKRLSEMVESRCGTTNCPAVTMISARLDAQEKDINHRWDTIIAQSTAFYAEGRKARMETHEILQGLYNRFNGFVEGTGAKMVDFVEVMVQREERRQKNNGGSF